MSMADLLLETLSMIDQKRILPITKKDFKVVVYAPSVEEEDVMGTWGTIDREVGGNPSIFVHSIIQILLLMKKILGEWNLMSSFQNFDLGVDVCKNQEKKNYRNKKCFRSHDGTKHTKAPLYVMGRKKEAFVAPAQLWKASKTIPNPQQVRQVDNGVPVGERKAVSSLEGGGSKKKYYRHAVQVPSGGGTLIQVLKGSRGGVRLVMGSQMQ